MEEKVTKIMDSGGTVDLVFLDFYKAFDSVNHHFLIQKLKAYGIHDNIVNWIESDTASLSNFLIPLKTFASLFIALSNHLCTVLKPLKELVLPCS